METGSASLVSEPTYFGPREGPFEGTIRLAPFNPTCSQAQQLALELLSLEKGDVLFDLGCGDGRLLISAASQTPGLQCVGIEIDPIYATRAKEAVLTAGLEACVEIRQGDVMELIGSDENHADGDGGGEKGRISLQSDATAVFLYLLPKGLTAIKPILEKAAQQRRKADTTFRVASYMFRIPGWDPVAVDRTTKGDCPLYLYKLPE